MSTLSPKAVVAAKPETDKSSVEPIKESKHHDSKKGRKPKTGAEIRKIEDRERFSHQSFPIDIKHAKQTAKSRRR